MTERRALFFDLDGTLTDPFEGIARSIVYALEKSGMDAPDPASLGWAIGPALVDTFAELGVDDPARALGHYRDRYAEVGLFENRLYSGAIEALEALRAAGHRMFLMTAKPHAYARRITAHFGIAPFMDDEFGPELDGTRNDKAELLAHGLAQTGARAAGSVMIGDRRHDHVAARANGLVSIAACWGYGDDGEDAMADHRCATLSLLPGLIAALDAG